MDDFSFTEGLSHDPDDPEELRLNSLLEGQETALTDAADTVRGHEAGVKPLQFVLDLVARFDRKRTLQRDAHLQKQIASMRRLVSHRDTLLEFLSKRSADPSARSARVRVLNGMCMDIKQSMLKREQDLRTAALEEASKASGKLRQIRREWLPVLEQAGQSERARQGARLLRAVGACSCRALLHHFIDSARQIQLPKDKLKLCIAEFGEDHVLAAVCRLMQLGAITFPLKSHYLTDIDGKFRRLQRAALEVSHDQFEPWNVRFKSPKGFVNIAFPGGRYVLFVHRDSEYWEMDIVTDYFTEVQRMSARRKDQALCPLLMFSEDKQFQRSLVQAGLQRPEGLTPFSLREAMWKCLKECTQFKATLAVSVMRMLRAKRVLDISAGWGDRLTGALAAGVERYVACDPNRALKEGHDAIIERFAPMTGGVVADGPDRGAERPRTRCEIVYEPFETAKLPRDEKNGRYETYNLVFTSPPFFDFEVYSSLEGQSMDNYVGLLEWTVDFLFVSLSRAWFLLEKGGHMAIHITDIPMSGVLVCEKMVLFMMWRLPGCSYAGCIGSSGHVRKPRPIWVCQKLGSTGGTEETRAARERARKRGEEAGRHLQEHFPDVHAAVLRVPGLGDWRAMRAHRLRASAKGRARDGGAGDARRAEPSPEGAGRAAAKRARRRGSAGGGGDEGSPVAKRRAIVGADGGARAPPGK
jgi:hypothetical protein